MPTQPITTFANQKLVPALYPHKAKTIAVKLAASVTLAKGTVLGELVGVQQVDQITITGTPTGGSFTLTVGGQITAAIPYNATPPQVQAALVALSTVGVNGVSCTGTALPGGTITATFSAPGAVAMTHTDSLTGGTTPAVSVSQQTAGSSGTPGTYAAYNAGNTNGSQTAKLILAYDAATDASGNITLGGQATGGEWGQTEPSVPAYMGGDFYTSDLVGLDAKAVSDLGAHFAQGTLDNGILVIPG